MRALSQQALNFADYSLRWIYQTIYFVSSYKAKEISERNYTQIISKTTNKKRTYRQWYNESSWSFSLLLRFHITCNLSSDVTFDLLHLIVITLTFDSYFLYFNLFKFHVNANSHYYYYLNLNFQLHMVLIVLICSLYPIPFSFLDDKMKFDKFHTF